MHVSTFWNFVVCQAPTVGTVLPVQYRHSEVKTPLDIYLQRHSPLLPPELWLRYSRLSARY